MEKESIRMNQLYSLWLHSVNLSNLIKYQLLQHFESSEAVFEANGMQYKTFGLTQEQIEKIEQSKGELDQLKKLTLDMANEGIVTLSIEEENYPELLREIPDPPIVLFLKGNLQVLKQPMLSIVGSRKCSEYGFEVAKQLAKELAASGITVVSGMARGIDEAAHKGALGGGTTIAVLGTGVDVCYPKQNQDLYHSILERGCIVSEFFPHTNPMPYQFPQRNRIISGLSVGTLVVEAALKSGSLITAHQALEQGRDVFAVPGNIYSVFSGGTNKLIQVGAKLVTCTQDIIEEFSNISIINQPSCAYNQKIDGGNGLDKVQIMVYDCLSWHPVELGEMLSQVDLPIQMIEMVLLQLEIKGLVQRLPGRRYARMK